MVSIFTFGAQVVNKGTNDANAAYEAMKRIRIGYVIITAFVYTVLVASLITVVFMELLMQYSAPQFAYATSFLSTLVQPLALIVFMFTIGIPAEALGYGG